MRVFSLGRILFIKACVLLAGVSSIFAANADESSATPADQEPKYLLFWGSGSVEETPKLVQGIGKRIGTKGDGEARLLGFGVSMLAFEMEEQIPDIIHEAFQAARDNDLAFMVHFDLHIFWQSRLELWNWFDEDKPGYDPENKRNVEWLGWDGPPSKCRYLDWGVVERMGPSMCFTSPAIRAEWERLIQKVIAPPLRKEVEALRKEGRAQLFAGVLVGSEPGFANYTTPHAATAKMMEEDGVPKASTGYRSLLDRGYSEKNPPEDLHEALAKITQETVAFWCEQFVKGGLPPSKLYPHVAATAPIEMMSAPIWTTFNEYCRPGLSTYPVMVLACGFKPIYTELAKHGNPPWAGVEANLGMPGAVVDWETYLGWHYNHGAVMVAINTGATGSDLPERFERSAFSDEAIAAYRKFFAGEPLVEKPVSDDHPEFHIQNKLKSVEAAAARWRQEGRDPESIVLRLQQQVTPLMQEGKIEEAERIFDRVLEELGAS